MVWDSLHLKTTHEVANAMAYDNTNKGALFRNERKTAENQPTHRGDIKVECPHCRAKSEFWMSAWTKEAGPKAKNPGQKYFSLSIEPKDSTGTSKPIGSTDFDDDIPF